MYLDKYTLLPDITQVAEEQHINQTYTKKRNYDELELLGYCQNCNKRMTSGDEVWETENGHYCSEVCENKFLEDELA